MNETLVLFKRMTEHPADSHLIDRYIETGGYEQARVALGRTTRRTGRPGQEFGSHRAGWCRVLCRDEMVVPGTGPSGLSGGQR